MSRLRTVISFYWRKPASANLQQAIREYLEPTFTASAESRYREEDGVCSMLELPLAAEGEQVRAFCRSYGVAYCVDLSDHAPDNEELWFFWGPAMDAEECGRAKIASFKLYEQRRSQAEPLLEDLSC